MKFFVSYTTRDKEITIDLLKSIATKLEKNGQVFIDIIDNDSLDKQKRVIAELDNSDLVILIESNSTYQSNWVMVELNRAVEKGIPIKVFTLKEILQNETIEIREEVYY